MICQFLSNLELFHCAGVLEGWQAAGRRPSEPMLRSALMASSKLAHRKHAAASIVLRHLRQSLEVSICRGLGSLRLPYIDFSLETRAPEALWRLSRAAPLVCVPRGKQMSTAFTQRQK